MRSRDKNRSASGAMSKEFLQSARTYLSEAFPNPDRAGCPPDSALRSLAFNPRESDATITEHIGTCSPCFKRYSELLTEFKAQQELEESSWNRAGLRRASGYRRWPVAPRDQAAKPPAARYAQGTAFTAVATSHGGLRAV